MRCPACAYENARDALVCSMCKRVLRREGDPLGGPDVPDAPHHALDLPGDRPLQLELAERPRRHSERPAPPPDSPGTNPTSARTISYRPPAPAIQIGAAERALDRIAGPFDWLVWLAARTRAERRDGASGTTRVGVIAQVLGSATLMVITAWLGAPPAACIAAGLLASLGAIGARAWIGRSWDRGGDPNPLAAIAVTWLPFLLAATIAVLGIGALVGGFMRPGPDAPIEATPIGRALIALAVAFYAATALASFARDRVRAARERG